MSSPENPPVRLSANFGEGLINHLSCDLTALSNTQKPLALQGGFRLSWPQSNNVPFLLNLKSGACFQMQSLAHWLRDTSRPALSMVTVAFIMPFYHREWYLLQMTAACTARGFPELPARHSNSVRFPRSS